MFLQKVVQVLHYLVLILCKIYIILCIFVVNNFQLNVMRYREIMIDCKPVLTIPNVEVRARDTTYSTTDSDGQVIIIKGRTFGVAASVRRNEFNMSICYGLSKSAYVLYFYIIFNLGYNSNVINLNFNRISSETKLSIRSVPNAINELIEKKVVYKTYKQSIYVVNPKCITNCSVVDFEKSYTDFSNRYIAEYNSNNELIYKEILE